MLSYFKIFKNNELAMGSFILFSLTIVANIFSYLFQFSMARMLGPADYSILAVITSTIYIFTIPMTSIQTIVSKYTTSFNVKKKYAFIKGMLKYLLKIMLIVSAVVFVVFIIISIFLSHRLNIDYGLLLLTGTFIFGSFLYPVASGIIQGMKKFFILGLNSILSCGIRFFVAVLLVFVGFKVYGAVLGFILGLGLSFIFLFFSMIEIKNFKSANGRVNIFSKQSIYTFFAMLCLVLLYSLDVIFAKSFFPSEMAGKYAVISMLGKIILFAVLAIGTAMFPINSEKFVRGYATSHILKKAILLASSICCVGLISFLFIPKFIITLLFGSLYASASGILIYTGLAFSFISLLNLFVLHKISIEKFKLGHMILLFILLILQTGLFLFMHDNIEQFAIAFALSSFVAFVGGIIILKK